MPEISIPCNTLFIHSLILIYFFHSSVCISFRFRMDMDRYVRFSVLLQLCRIFSAPDITLFSFLLRKCCSTVAIHITSLPLHLPCFYTEFSKSNPRFTSVFSSISSIGFWIFKLSLIPSRNPTIVITSTSYFSASSFTVPFTTSLGLLKSFS